MIKNKAEKEQRLEALQKELGNAKGFFTWMQELDGDMPISRPDFGPLQVRGLQDLIPGRRYAWSSLGGEYGDLPHTRLEILIREADGITGQILYSAIQDDGRAEEEVFELYMQDVSILPYMGRWNPYNYLEKIVEN